MAETTTGAVHKNTREMKGSTQTQLTGEKATCAAGGIKAYCEHTGAKKGEGEAPKGGEGGQAVHARGSKGAAPKPVYPVKAPKPGEPGHQGEGQRFAKEEAEPPKPVPPRPGQPAPPPKPGPKSLVLQVVPTPRKEPKEDEKKGVTVKGAHNTEVSDGIVQVGLVKHVTATGDGDLVKISAEPVGTSPNCPKWTIKDHGTGHSVPQMHHTSGKSITFKFMPPDPKELEKHIIQNPFFKMAWLDVVQPRHYTVGCEAPFPTPPAHHPPAGNHRAAPPARHPQAPAAHQAPPPPAGEHHTLDVFIYPSDKWTLKLTTEESAIKPPWEEKLEAAKKAIEGLIEHFSELASARDPLIPKVTIKLMEGEISLSNFWEEEEGSNLVHWKAELEGKITFIDLNLKFNVDSSKFLEAAKSFSRVAKTAEKAAEKFAEFLKKEAGLSAEASLYIVVKIIIAVKGTASWEKDETGKITPHLDKMTVKLTAGAGVGGELEVDRMTGDKKEVLVKFEGDGTSEMTLATSPRLGPSGNLWLDNKYTWKPLAVTLTAQVNPKDKTKKGELPDASTQAAPGLPELDWNWSGDLLPEIKERPLPSLNLTTRQWESPPAEEQKPLTVKVSPLPPLKPALAPPPRPVAVPQIKG